MKTRESVNATLTLTSSVCGMQQLNHIAEQFKSILSTLTNPDNIHNDVHFWIAYHELLDFFRITTVLHKWSEDPEIVNVVQEILNEFDGKESQYPQIEPMKGMIGWICDSQ